MFLIMILDLDVKFEKSMWYQKKKKNGPLSRLNLGMKLRKKSLGLSTSLGVYSMLTLFSHETAEIVMSECR